VYIATRILAPLAAIAPVGAPLVADVLVLKDGKTIEGEVAPKDGAYEVKTKFGTLSVDKADVVKIVAGPDAMAAEAGTLRATARSMIDAAASVSDPALQSRKLGAAVEILEKALEIVTEARAIFKGDAHAHLDKTAAELMREIRETRDRIPAGSSSPAAPPPHAPKPPAPTPAGEPLGGDLLLPPTLPASLRVPPGERAPTAEEPEAPQPRRPLWAFLHEHKAALIGKTLKLRLDDNREPVVAIRDILREPYDRIAFLPSGGDEEVRVGAHHLTAGCALELARLALDEKDPAQLLAVAGFHARLGAPETALALYAKACEAGAPPAADELAAALKAFAEACASSPPAEYSATMARVEALRAKTGTDAPPDLAAAFDAAAAVFKDAERLKPAIRKLAEARLAAERKRYPDALAIAQQVAKQFPDTPIAREAEAFIDTLPHPDGRLICGFDSPAELRRWTQHPGYYGGAFQFIPTTDEREVREGKGAAKLVLGKDPRYSNGALSIELPDFDPLRARAISLWIFQPQISSSRLELAFIRGKQQRLPWPDSYGASELGDCLYRAVPMNVAGWRQLRFSLNEFQVRGRITWREVGALVLYEPSRKGIDIILDSLRLLETDKK